MTASLSEAFPRERLASLKEKEKGVVSDGEQEKTVPLDANDDDLVFFYLGSYMKNERRRQKMPRERIAVAVDLSVGSVSNMERGRQRMTLMVFVRWCLVLSVDPGRVLGDVVRDMKVRPFEADE